MDLKLLQFYGDPGAERATTSRLALLAVECLTSCQTRLIVIDDLQFVDFHARQRVEVFNHVKWLTNEAPVTFISPGLQLSDLRFFGEASSASRARLHSRAR